jgi:hypothetical protein
MEINQASSRRRIGGPGGPIAMVKGKGFVMFGKEASGKWFERWFPTEAKARTAARRNGWYVK